MTNVRYVRFLDQLTLRFFEHFRVASIAFKLQCYTATCRAMFAFGAAATPSEKVVLRLITIRCAMIDGKTNAAGCR